MKDSLICILNAFHKLLVYFMIFGCLLPEKYLWIHLLLWPIVYVHWQFNDEKCCLTQLELYLKYNTSRKDAPKVEHDHGEDFYFLRKLLADFNLNLTIEQMHTGTYVVFTTSWFISFIRYLVYKKWFENNEKLNLKEKEDK